MATVDVDDSSLSANPQAKSVGLVGGLAAIWRSVCIHQMNRVNACNRYDHIDSTINADNGIIISTIVTIQLLHVHLRLMLTLYVHRQLHRCKTAKSAAVAEMGDRGHNRHGPKRGGAAVPLSQGAGTQSNTMWPGPTSTSVPSGVFIHPAVWLQ